MNYKMQEIVHGVTQPSVTVRWMMSMLLTTKWMELAYHPVMGDSAKKSDAKNLRVASMHAHPAQTSATKIHVLFC